MDQSQTQQFLRDGIQAIQRGDRARGRELLLQVVAADEGIEPAWLWLSRVVDDPADQLVALENALTLNPANAAAQEQARALRVRLGLAAPPAEAPAPSAPPPPAPPDDDVLDNDPDQCVYCGKITETEATSCPFCRRSLLKAGFWQGNAAYWWLILLGGVVLHSAIYQPGLALIGLVLRNSHVPAFLAGLPVPDLPAGVSDVQTFLSSMPLFFMTVRILLWLIAFFIIIVSQSLAPGTAAVASLLDGAFTGLGYMLGWVSAPTALTYASLDFGLLVLATAALVEKSQARVRQHTVLDRNIYGHVEFHRHGCLYAQQGKWALAALHFQRAMVLGQRFSVYYQDLSAAQLRLGRTRQAERTLRMGLEMLPEDAELKARLAELDEG